MRLGKKMLKILARTELGVELAVVNNAVVTAQRAFSGQLANGLQRHYPDDIHTHLFQLRQLGFRGAERAFWGQLTCVQFVDRCVISKLRMFGLLCFLLGARHDRQCRQQEGT